MDLEVATVAEIGKRGDLRRLVYFGKRLFWRVHLNYGGLDMDFTGL